MARCAAQADEDPLSSAWPPPILAWGGSIPWSDLVLAPALDLAFTVAVGRRWRTHNVSATIVVSSVYVSTELVYIGFRFRAAINEEF